MLIKLILVDITSIEEQKCKSKEQLELKIFFVDIILALEAFRKQRWQFKGLGKQWMHFEFKSFYSS